MAVEVPNRTRRTRKPVAVGMGLVALDVVFSATDAVPKCYGGGTCGNVLAILSYLGWRAVPVSRLRGDRAGERLLDDLRHWRVSTQFITQQADGSTPIVIQRIRRTPGGTARHSFSWRCPSCGGYLPGYKPVLASTIEALALRVPDPSVFFFDRVSRATLLMARLSRKRGALIVFEPASVGDPALFREAWELAHVVKYSHERLSEMSELGLGEDAGGTGVLLEVETVGAEGLRYRSRLANAATAGWSTSASYPVADVRDTSGAGDWCTAGLLHSLARKGAKAFEKTTQPQLERALAYSQALAAWNCRFEGARGGMYHSSRAQFELDLRNILRGRLSEEAGGADRTVKARDGVAEFCQWCNAHTSRDRVAVSNRR